MDAGSIPAISTKKSSFYGTRIFLFKPTGLVYHHDAVVYIIAEGVYHHTEGVYFCRLDDIQLFTKLMICNSYGIDDIQGLRLDLFCTINIKKQTAVVCVNFTSVENN